MTTDGGAMALVTKLEQAGHALAVAAADLDKPVPAPNWSIVDG